MVMSKEELLKWFEEMWESATIGDTWKLNDEARQAYQQIKHAITVFYNVIQPESRPIEESEIYQIGYKKGKEENQPEVDKEFVER